MPSSSSTVEANVVGSGGGSSKSKFRPRREKKPAEIVKTWAFDSVGNRKYALQIKKAGNGNPCLLLVEGVPQDDGSYRKFNITLWSEDFPSFFNTLDQVRQFMTENNIRTPEGHKYDARKGGARKSGKR